MTSETPNVDTDDNVKMVLSNDEKSRQLIDKLDDVVKSLSNDLIASRQLNVQTDKGIKDINQSNNQRKITFIKTKFEYRVILFFYFCYYKFDIVVIQWILLYRFYRTLPKPRNFWKINRESFKRKGNK